MKKIFAALTAIVLAAGVSLAAVAGPALAVSTPTPAATSTPSTTTSTTTPSTTPTATPTAAPSSTPAATPSAAPAVTPQVATPQVVTPQSKSLSTTSLGSTPSDPYTTDAYMVVVWSMPTASPPTNAATYPQTLVTATPEKTISAAELNVPTPTTCGTQYQVDIYNNSAAMRSMLALATLAGPNDGDQDSAFLANGHGFTPYALVYNAACPVLVCLPAAAVSYTYSHNDKNEGVITVTNPNTSKYTNSLCDPFYVTAASWTYTGASTWPQSIDKVDHLGKISSVGTYSYNAQVTCGQGDIYASTSASQPSITPEHPGYLVGPGNPISESFLSGMGFKATTYTGATYVNDDASCYTAPKPADSVVSCTSGSVNSLTLPAVVGGTWSYTVNGTTTKLPIDTALPTFTPTVFGSYTITLADGSSKDAFTVKGGTWSWSPTDPSTLDCNTTVPTVDATYTDITTCNVAGSLTITPVASVDYYVGTTQVTKGLVVLPAATAAESGLTGSVSVIAKAEAGYEFSHGVTEVDFTPHDFGTETNCVVQTSFGDCLASAESVTMSFVNPSTEGSAQFVVTGGSNNVTETFVVQPGETLSNQVIDSAAASGTPFMVSINGAPATPVAVDFTGCTTVKPGDPSTTSATCDVATNSLSGTTSISVDLETGLSYDIKGTGTASGFTELTAVTLQPGQAAGSQVVASGVPAGSYTITVTGTTGYVLDPSVTAPDGTWIRTVTIATPECDFGATSQPADCTVIPPATNGAAAAAVATKKAGAVVTAAATTFSATAGVPSITIVPSDEVVYTAYDTAVTPTFSEVLTKAVTNVNAGTWYVAVTLSDKGVTDGYTLTGGSVLFPATAPTTGWDLNAFCPPPLATFSAGVSSTDATCSVLTTTAGTITLTHSASEPDKITYKVVDNATGAIVYDGTDAADKVLDVKPGAYTVTAIPPTGDGISGNTQVHADGSEVFPTITVALVGTNCGGPDGSLAFTGGTIAWLGFVLAGGMLFLGFALLFVRRRGNRTAE